jgi:hypothetical protein
MRLVMTTVFLGLAGLLYGCGSSDRQADRAQERAYEAQERVAQQRLNLVDKYQKCVRDAGSDQGFCELGHG